MAPKQEMKNYNTITPIDNDTVPERKPKKWSKKEIIAIAVCWLALVLAVLILTAYCLCRDQNNKSVVDECSSSPCSNGGGCFDEINGYTCTCDEGYTGTHCETDVDECSSGPCQNGGTCVDLVGNYTCRCPVRFTGNNCETDTKATCSELGSATAVAVYDSTITGQTLHQLGGISISSITGSVAVADYGGNKIHVMDAELNTQNVIVQNTPADTTYDDKGFLYVTDNTDHMVHVYDSTGNLTSSFGTQGTGPGEFNYPWGITWNKSGVLPELYVCDPGNKRVQVLHTNGTFIAEFGANLFDEGNYYIAVDTNIYVSERAGPIFIFDNTYTLINTIFANKLPAGIALYNGCLIVANAGTDNIKVFDNNNSLVATIGSDGTSAGQLDKPEGIAVTPLGAVYVTNKGNTHVQLFKV